MNVLHVIPAVAARYGGPSLAVMRMCRALRTRGIAASIATTDADGPRRLSVPHGIETNDAGVPTYFFRRTFSERFKMSLGLSRWLGQNVERFDLVHIHAIFSHSSFSAARACRRKQVPYVLRPLGSLDPWALRQKSWQKRSLLTGPGRSMFAHATAVHFTTEEERRLAELSIGKTHGVVIPLGVDDELISAPMVPYGERQPYVLALGRLHPKKNLEFLIDTFAEATAAHALASWRLVVAGDGDPVYRRQLEAHAGRTTCGDRISFPGWVGADAKVSLLRQASLFAMPSHQENFGLSLVEALACGVPAVVSQSVNLAGDMEAAGAGWVATDDGAFKRAFVDALTSTTLRERRAEGARRFAQRFTWASVAESLEALYTSVRGSRRAEPVDAANLRASRPALPETR